MPLLDQSLDTCKPHDLVHSKQDIVGAIDPLTLYCTVFSAATKGRCSRSEPIQLLTESILVRRDTTFAYCASQSSSLLQGA